MSESNSMKSFCGVNSDPIADVFSNHGSGNLSPLPFHTTDDEKMAAGGAASEFTKCSYCSGVYREPKRLPCLHTFCLRCLEQLITSVIDSGNEQIQELDVTGLGVDGAKKINRSKMIECPTCGISFTVPDGGLQDIQTNDFVNRLVEICQSQPVSNADSNDCISSCDGTGDRRCEGSSDIVRITSDPRTLQCSTQGDSNNNVESFWEMSSSAERRHSDVLARQTADCEVTAHKPAAAAVVGRALCRRHNSQPYVTFCSEPACSLPVCITCTLVGHRNHRFVELEDAANQLRQQLRRKSSDIASRLTESRARVTRVTDRYKKADDRVQQMRCQVSQHFDEIVRRIEESRDRCLNNIDTRFTKDVEPLLNCREAARKETARLEKAISSIENVLKTENDFDVFEIAVELDDDSSAVIDDEVCTKDELWCIKHGNELLKSLDLQLEPIVNNLLENVSTLCARNASCCTTEMSVLSSEKPERVSTDTVVCNEATDRNACVGDKLHLMKGAQNCVETTAAAEIDSTLLGDCLKDLTPSHAASAMPPQSNNARPSRLSNGFSGNNSRERNSESSGGRATAHRTPSSNANGPERPPLVTSLENALLQESIGRLNKTPSTSAVVRAGRVKINGTSTNTPQIKSRFDFNSSDSDSNQSSSLTTSNEKLEVTSDTNLSDTESGIFGVVVYNLAIPFGCTGGGLDDVDFFLDLCQCVLHYVPEVELSECRRLGNLPPWLTPSHFLVEDLWRTATYKIPLLITCKKASDAQLLVSEASRIRDAFNIEGFRIKTYHPPKLQTKRSSRLQRSYSKD